MCAQGRHFGDEFVGQPSFDGTSLRVLENYHICLSKPEVRLSCQAGRYYSGMVPEG